MGITSRLAARVVEHRTKINKCFTSRYNFDVLVYYEEFSEVTEAIAREKEIKGWLREKKLKLILEANPNWEDLSLVWEENPSWKAIPEAKPRPMLKRNLRLCLSRVLRETSSVCFSAIACILESMASNRNRLAMLKKLIAETDLILSTTPLPQKRTARCCELLSTALAIADDLLTQSKMPAAAILGKKGGA